jgi:hypothetical protein
MLIVLKGGTPSEYIMRHAVKKMITLAVNAHPANAAMKERGKKILEAFDKVLLCASNTTTNSHIEEE